MAKKLMIMVIYILCLGTMGSWTTASANEVKQQVEAVPIGVTKIEVGESEILDSEELQAIIGEYEDRTLTVTELQAAVAKINALYKSKGYMTAKAVLPAQTVKNGVVKLQLVEGRYGTISLRGNAYTKDSFVLNRLRIRSGELVQLPSLQREMLFFNSTTDVQVRAEVNSGAELGTTDCVIHVVEPAPAQLVLFNDNGGRVETGLWRMGTSLVMKSFFGYRDSLGLSVVTSAGSLALAASYSVPVGTRGTRLDLAYSQSDVEVISGEFETVNIAGLSSDRGISLRHPLLRTPQHRVDGSLDFHSNESGSYFSGAKLITKNTDTITVGTTIDSEAIGVVRHLGSGVTFGSRRDKDGAPFMKYNGDFSLSRMLKRGSVLTYRALLQLTGDRLLPPSQQFSAGGLSTVRGFSEGVLVGDSGYLMSLESRHSVTKRITGVFFIDHAGTDPFKGNDEQIDDRDFITSMGVEADIAFSRYTSGKVVFGAPFDGSEPWFHFVLQTAF